MTSNGVNPCYLCGEEAKRYVEKNGHTLYRCGSCDFIFVSPLPPSTGEIYGKDYFEGAERGFGYVDYDADKEPMVTAFKKYLVLIEKTSGGKGKLLDVGAATGFFVKLAREASFDASGIELSDHAASMGRARGLDIKTGTLNDVSDTYDVVTMIDVIEHVPDPKVEVRRAASLLRAGGILAINTPDAGSLMAQALGKHWQAIVPPEHLYYFDKRNLRALLENEGFVVLIETRILKRFTPPYILKTLYKWTGMGFFDRLASLASHLPLRQLSIPADLHDNMFVLARKR